MCQRIVLKHISLWLSIIKWSMYPIMFLIYLVSWVKSGCEWKKFEEVLIQSALYWYRVSEPRTVILTEKEASLLGWLMYSVSEVSLGDPCHLDFWRQFWLFQLRAQAVWWCSDQRPGMLQIQDREYQSNKNSLAQNVRSWSWASKAWQSTQNI